MFGGRLNAVKLMPSETDAGKRKRFNNKLDELAVLENLVGRVTRSAITTFLRLCSFNMKPCSVLVVMLQSPFLILFY